MMFLGSCHNVGLSCVPTTNHEEELFGLEAAVRTGTIKRDSSVHNRNRRFCSSVVFLQVIQSELNCKLVVLCVF